jgi:Fusaric acid resistance protein-like
MEGGLLHMPGMRLAHLHAVRWLGQRDRGFAALRRATRAAIVMPAMFAVGEEVIGNPQVATFAAFGSFAMLLLADFGGPMAERLQAQAALAVTGGVFVCLATLASQTAWLAAVSMAVAGFGVIFAGVVSSVLAGATTALLLTFILPVSLAAPASAVPDRLAGWGMAAGAALVATVLLWPAPARDRLRGAAAAACRALAARLRAGVAYLLSGMDEQAALDRDHAAAQSDQAVEALRSAFLATPYRPTGLSTPARTTVRLVDELIWLNGIVIQPGLHRDGVHRAALRVREAAAAVLDRAADLLDSRGGSSDELGAALTELAAAHAEMQEGVTAGLPARSLRPASDRAVAGPPAGPQPSTGDPAAGGERVSEFITSLDPAFRAEELSYAVSLIARTAGLTAAAERRSWRERWLGRQPEGVPGTLSAARERITSYLEPHSVWLHNSLRGAAGLGLAVLVARLTGVQHSFWVVLGALSVLRSNALNTGQDAVRAILGTVAGFIVGAALLVGIGTNTTLLWFLLPLAVFLAGVAPAVISFAAGQAAFTITLMILFNIIQPTGWRVGLVRIEDVALGVGVSLLVGLLFWPRGAAAALRQALGEAYADSARYLASTVRSGVSPGDAGTSALAAPAGDAARAAAASRRLDDAFRTYLAERGPKRLRLAEVAGLVTGVAGLRLEADAVLDLWRGGDGRAGGDVAAARQEILGTADRVTGWYDALATTIITGGELPQPLAADTAADGRLVRAVRRDLLGDDGKASATAIRMIWTDDHLDVVRRQQAAITSPARATGGQLAGGRMIPPPPRRFPALLR